MNPDIEVLDVLTDNLYRDPTDINVIPISFSIQSDSPPVQEARQGQGLRR